MKIRRLLFFSLLKPLLTVFDFIIPKDKSLFVFGYKSTLYADNSRYFFEYIRENNLGVNAVWMTLNKDLHINLQRKYGKKSCALINSLSGLWIFLRARVAIYSHGSYDLGRLISHYSPKLIVNLSHGQTFKADTGYGGIYYRSRKQRRIKIEDRVDLFAVSSQLEAYSIKFCFGRNLKRPIVSGFPRNDILLLNLKKQIEDEILILKQRLKINFIPKHVILYAPTWRKDGTAKLFPLKDLNFQQFNKLMIEHDGLLLIRGHRNDFSESSDLLKQADKNIRNKEWIRFIHQSEFPDIQEILHMVTLLITDYSSIFFDFLLVNRPIFFITPDFEEYNEEIGFLYPYDLMAPGPKINTDDDFLAHLKAFLEGTDSYADQRSWVSTLLFEQNQPIARKIILEEIKSNINWKI
ncbi:MAG: CDP-glycerol glycerophosphotransferase family protein [Candidatus Heimdallarchaeota archaeon]